MTTRVSSRVERPSAAARASTLAAVEIGTARYHIHRPLLEKHSEYFKKALNGPWKESQEGAVKLEDVECGVFEIFIDWLYTGTLPDSLKRWRNANDDPAALGAGWLAILKACALGDRLVAVNFRNTADLLFISNFIGCGYSSYYNAIIFAFANLPLEHNLLTFLVDTHCQNHMIELDTDENGEKELRSQLPKELLLRAMLRHSELKSKDGAGDLIPCDYHGHSSKEERETCEKKVDIKLDIDSGSDSEQDD